MTTKYDPDYDYDDYEAYSDRQVTSVGLPPSQLALLIGVNAVISLIISVAVVLIANRQVAPGDVPPAAGAEITPAATVALSANGDAAEAAAQATPAPQTTPLESVSYTVEAGDSVSLIAERFSVSMFDLMRANGLSDEDFIQVGQELVIPLGGLPDVTPTFTPAPQLTETPLPFDPPTPLPADEQAPPEPAVTVGPTTTPTPTPLATATPVGTTSAELPTPLPTSTAAPQDAVNVTISEVIAPGVLSQETLIIFNQGAGVSLLDWKLQGSPLGNFVFPDIFLFSGGSIRVHTAAGQNSPSDLYLGQGEAAWPPGVNITLKDADNTTITQYAVTVQ